MTSRWCAQAGSRWIELEVRAGGPNSTEVRLGLGKNSVFMFLLISLLC